jgi:hypothetical protein
VAVGHLVQPVQQRHDLLLVDPLLPEPPRHAVPAVQLVDQPARQQDGARDA